MISAEYITHSGNDLLVVNAARASFGTRKTESEFNATDIGLIKFLASGASSKDLAKFQEELTKEELISVMRSLPTHWTPFAHPQITLVEKMPIFVARQRFKHTVGFVYNEISRRYKTEGIEFYTPEILRERADNVKQGSKDEAIQHNMVGLDLVRRNHDRCLVTYNDLLEMGVCAEQARAVLPQDMMITVWTTGSLYAFAKAFNSRIGFGAQKEISQLANKWDEIISPLFPVSWNALTQDAKKAAKLTR